METLHPEDSIAARATFGRRKIAPRVCIADSKPHIRQFLRDALEELGFVVGDCDLAGDLRAAVTDQRADLFVSDCRPAASPPAHFSNCCPQ